MMEAGIIFVRTFDLAYILGRKHPGATEHANAVAHWQYLKRRRFGCRSSLAPQPKPAAAV